MKHPSNKVTLENVDDLTIYHPPTDDTKRRYDAINKATNDFLRVILRTAPDCADRSAALRTVRTARMEANSAIACSPSAELAAELPFEE